MTARALLNLIGFQLRQGVMSSPPVDPIVCQRRQRRLPDDAGERGGAWVNATRPTGPGAPSTSIVSQGPLRSGFDALNVDHFCRLVVPASNLHLLASKFLGFVLVVELVRGLVGRIVEHELT